MTANRLETAAFTAAWLFVIGSSVYDGYWVLANRQMIASFERNPLGRLLIQWNNGDVWLLLTAKTLGTLAAASILLLVYWTRPQLGWLACLAATAMQLALICWLLR
jgi:hypothetical protein